MGQHNLGAVFHFELTRTISKKRFWLTTLAVPLIMAVVFALIYVSNTATASASDAQETARFSVAYSDKSGLITAEQAASFSANKMASVSDGIRAVKEGAVDAYFEFPADPTSTAIKVYGADQGIFENNKYSAVAQAMLSQAVEAKIGSPELSTLAGGKATVDVTTFRGTEESGGVNTAIPPLSFLLVFYALILLLAGQMLSSTLEEKENRVTEMILTTLKPTTLICGKVVALFAIGLIQILFFISPIVVGYLFFREQINIPDFDLTSLVFDPVLMTQGFLILVGGFALFTTTLVALGAIMPTAKEAGGFMGVVIALIFVPFYAITLIFSNPQSPIVQIFTYFPFSSPVTALLRNGLGSLSTGEATAVIAILYVGAAAMFLVAVRLFQHGSISYSSKVNIRNALRRARRVPTPAGHA
jgi:ABC-2 type transport system permease protein